jgi:hypothetical protein
LVRHDSEVTLKDHIHSDAKSAEHIAHVYADGLKNIDHHCPLILLPNAAGLTEWLLGNKIYWGMSVFGRVHYRPMPLTAPFFDWPLLALSGHALLHCMSRF